jgi:hypothetical protein
MQKVSHYEVLKKELLEDLGFQEIVNDFHGNIDYNFEEGYFHPCLDPKNLILIYCKDWGYAFRQRKNAITHIGKMYSLDDLINGFKFVTVDYDVLTWNDGSSCR